MKYALLCGKLFTAGEIPVRENMVILVEGETIRSVRSGTVPPEGYEAVDLSSCFVTPGLIDAHVHLTSTGSEPQGERGYVLPGELTIQAVKNARRDLMAGFTTVRDCGAEEYINHSIRDAVARGELAGPRVFSCGRCITPTGGHADRLCSPYMESRVQAAMPIDGPMEARRAARFNLKHSADFLKVMVTGGVICKGSSVGTQYMTDDEISAVVEIAGIYGVPTAAHAHGTSGIKAAARAGITSVEHAMMMDDEAVDLFCEKGTYHTPTIITGERIITEGPVRGLPQWMIDKARCVSERHEWGLREGLKRGVRFSFGTDAGTPYNFHGRQTQEFALMTRYGFTPLQALTAATATNAALLGVRDRLGRVEAGFLADLCAFPGDPREDIRVMERCCFVMQGGRICKEPEPQPTL